MAAPLLFDTVQFQIGNVNERIEFDAVECTITICASDAYSAIPRVERVLHACGSSLKTIKVCRYYHRVGGEDCTPIVSLIEKYCPNIESLAFGRQYSSICTSARLVQRYGSQLRSIRYSQIVLEKLPNFDVCTGLLRFDCEFRHTDTLILVLQSIGSTLEELSFRFDDITDPDEVLRAIQTHCKRLSVIRLNDYWFFGTEILRTSLLCSYGPQLVKADVGGLSLASLREVARACLNIRTSFVFDIDWDETKWEFIRAIGLVIDDLSLETYPCAGEESSSAMAQCLNLRRLRVENENFIVSDEIMDSMFANSTFIALEELDIIGLLPSKLNFQLIAKSTLNLRKVTLHMMRSIDNGNTFESIVDSNPFLAEVIIRESSWFNCGRHADTAFEILQNLLRKFAKCRKLHIYLRIVHEDDVNENQLRNICRYLPCRGMNLMVRISKSLYEHTS